ncbi:MAG: hypothetical protein KF699_11755 [Phycisphaeraceae bacterium]|nr:hypothetical protein [Phycisphaeraceae bacterium]
MSPHTVTGRRNESKTTWAASAMNEVPLKALLDRIVPDPWRTANPYSEAFASATSQVLNAASDADRSEVLSAWLEANQPCLFGRTAAKLRRIEFCFLSEADLYAGDDHVTGRIAKHRLQWRRRAFKGESSAFIILAYSELFASAEPNDDLFLLAQKLAELYLMQEVPEDAIRHDTVMLKTPTERLSWKVGANFFGAQGEGRWWADHRIPAGFGLSMNSVGHFACVNRMERGGAEGDQRYGLDSALRIAMQLLNSTLPGPDGRNTWLLEVADKPEPVAVRCPVALPKALNGKNRCEYAGLYHTDQTLPRAYFLPDPRRPEGPHVDGLDLTYLFHDSPDNPDYRWMGVGVPE